MSGTHTNTKRRADDAYMTPLWAVDAILQRLPVPLVAYEPACGSGRIMRATRSAWPESKIVGSDICPGATACLERARGELAAFRSEANSIIASGNKVPKKITDIIAACENAVLALEREVKLPDIVDPMFKLDFLHDDPPIEQPNLIITNPPYSLAMQFVERAFDVVHPCGFVVMNLRMGFAASQGRAHFHDLCPSDMFVLPKRPSYTDNGRTDGYEYAWFVWDMRNVHRRNPAPGNWHILTEVL